MEKTAETVLVAARANNEPVFVLRARDKFAVDALSAYFISITENGCDISFVNEVHKIMMDFYQWKVNCPEQMKIPD